MTEPEPTRPFALDQFFPYRINVLASRISRDLAQVYERRFGISIPEWRVLAHLAANQRVSVREIFIRVDMDKSKVSRAAASLETAGLIRKATNPADRRLVELSLTRKGQRLFDRIAPLALGFETQLLQTLTTAEREALESIIAKLTATLAETGTS